MGITGIQRIHENPMWMEANVAGFPQGWKDMSRDSCWDGKILYVIPAEV